MKIFILFNSPNTCKYGNGIRLNAKNSTTVLKYLFVNVKKTWSIINLRQASLGIIII